MTNKISNSNKSNIHIHIGDKGKKKRRNRRKTASRRHGGGIYVMNNISAPAIPLFNRPQTLDTSMGDERERERIRIQKGVFESQTPSNNTSNTFANGAPQNDYNAFLGNLKQYLDGKKKATKPPTPLAPPAPAHLKQEETIKTEPQQKSVVHKKQVAEQEPSFKHKVPSVYAPVTQAQAQAQAAQAQAQAQAAQAQAQAQAQTQTHAQEQAQRAQAEAEAQYRSGAFSSQNPQNSGLGEMINSNPVPSNASAMVVEPQNNDSQKGKYTKEFKYEDVSDVRKHRKILRRSDALYRKNMGEIEKERKEDEAFLANLNSNYRHK